MRMRAVLFDLDGTLLDRTATFRRHLRAMIERHPEVFQGCGAADLIEELVELDQNGFADRTQFYQSLAESLNLRAGSAQVLLEYFEAEFPESCVAMPQAKETLESLRALGVKLGLITNGRGLIQNRKIDGLEIRHCFDSIVISGDLGIRKPDPRIFETALAELGVHPSSAAYVGDNPEPDILGAKGSGMLAVWRRDPWWPAPQQADLVIDELGELVPALFGDS